MRTGLIIALVCALIISMLIGWITLSAHVDNDSDASTSPETIVIDVTKLPQPLLKGKISLEETLQQRRSIREYSNESVSLGELSQLLWAAQGITSSQGFRTTPSAGALYPLEVYAINATGIYHYNPPNHSLEKISSENVQDDLTKAALNQNAVRQAPLKLVITGVFERTTVKYGDRAERYILLEAGHAAQNVLLECTSLGLGAVPIGAFDDVMVREVIQAPANHQPLYIIPIGHVS